MHQNVIYGYFVAFCKDVSVHCKDHRVVQCQKRRKKAKATTTKIKEQE